MTPRLKAKYNDEIHPALREEMGCNPMQVPASRRSW
jgi:hypothetical protein